MKILMFCTNSNRSGAPIQMMSLARGALNQYLFLFGNSGPMVEYAKKYGQTKVLGGTKSDFNLLKDIYMVLKVRSIYKEFDPHVIHLHSTKAGFIGRLAALGTKYSSRIVYTVHGIPFDRNVKVFQRTVVYLIELFFSYAFGQAYIFLSYRDCTFAVKMKLRIKKCSVIYNGVNEDLGEALPDNQLKNRGGNVNTACMIARVGWQKDHELLFKSFELSKLDNLILVGPGTDCKEFIERAKKYCPKKNKKIQFIGETNQVKQYIRMSDFTILASRYEGVPLVLLESLACKTPFIASEVGGVAEIVQISNGGKLVVPGNVASMTEAINEFTNPIIIEKYINSIKSGLPKQLTLSTMVSRTHDLYRKVVEEAV